MAAGPGRLKRSTAASDQWTVRAHLKAIFGGGLGVAAMVLGALIVVAPFAAVFSGGSVDLGAIRIVALAAVVCLYGLTALAGLDIRGSRPRASLLSSTVVALSVVGLLAALFALWPGVGVSAQDTHARWLIAGMLLALTVVTLAIGMLRRSLEG